MNSPTQKSLALLREEGYTVGVVERFNPWAKIRQDLFGFIDIVAIKSDISGVLGIQTTTASNITARIKKAKDNLALLIWLKAGNRVEFHGWRLAGKRGKRKTWQVNRRALIEEDLL